MTSTSATEPKDGSQGQEDGPGRMLRSVFELLDRYNFSYCVPHGYENYPNQVASDVDLVLDGRVSARTLQSMLVAESPNFGARVVRARGRHFVLAGQNSDGSQCFLTLDIDVASQFDGIVYFGGPQMLNGRRRRGAFWVPAPGVEFAAYAARCVARERLDPHRTDKLAALCREAPDESRAMLSQLLSAPWSQRLTDALISGDWTPVVASLPLVASDLRRRALFRYPLGFLGTKLEEFLGRTARLLRPDGLTVVVLGPDGAGKSSTTEALGETALLPTFDRSVCQGFVPPIHRLIGRNHGPSSEPHALPPRSLPNSILRWFYWLSYSYMDQVRVHLRMARGTLVLYDRHLLDLLVDQRRYRYSGPLWPMRLICQLAPKPDLVITLDAPAELIQTRKQEVPPEETARQRQGYLDLSQSLRCGRVADASQSLNKVTAQLNGFILDFLAIRIAKRLGLPHREPEPIENQDHALRVVGGHLLDA